MKIIILGGNGWIGSYLLKFLTNHEVILANNNIRVNNYKDIEQCLNNHHSLI